MSRYPRYPYQNTLTSTSTHATSLPGNNNHANHHHHHHGSIGRNPWVGAAAACGSHSGTNSSSSSRTYRGWHHRAPPHELSAAVPHARPIYHDHVGVLVDGPGLVPGGARATIVRHSISSRSDRAVTPASSPGGGSASRAAVDGCGGHCVAFETFCYYCLQVVFIAGMLTGVSLVIAGSVLRHRQRGGDLMVLVYIGVLMVLVCALLLAVQCCVRRNVKQRKRSLRAATRRIATTQPPLADIPMQDLKLMQVGNVDSRGPGAQQQYQPLLMHIVQQQQQTSNTTIAMETLPRHLHHPPAYRSGNTSDTSGYVGGGMMDVSRSGAPWWRRNPDMVESRH